MFVKGVLSTESLTEDHGEVELSVRNYISKYVDKYLKTELHSKYDFWCSVEKSLQLKI